VSELDFWRIIMGVKDMVVKPNRTMYQYAISEKLNVKRNIKVREYSILMMISPRKGENKRNGK
jgi:hypothetical protein